MTVATRAETKKAPKRFILVGNKQPMKTAIHVLFL